MKKKINPRVEQALAARERFISASAFEKHSPMKYIGCNECSNRFKCFTEREGFKSKEVTNDTGKCLVGWKEVILDELPFVDLKPYSHNIISLALNAIARGWGNKEANKAITEYSLESLGWRKVRTKKTKSNSAKT